MSIAPSSPPASVFMPTLPGRYYTDPAIFELEKRYIFSRQWQYVCRTQDVPTPGRFIRVTVGDENVIVVRGRDGQLRAFLNVCRHRGATLCAAEAGDVGRSIRCSYHSWSYRLDGSLMSAPNWDTMAGANKADLGLHPVHLAEFHGLVWVNLADEPGPLEDQVWPQLDYRLDGDRAKFLRYDLAALVAGKRIDYTGCGQLEDHPGELPGVLPLLHHPPRAGGHAAAVSRHLPLPGVRGRRVPLRRR